MTREEVIKHLDDLLTFAHEPTEEDREALGIAIDILQKSDTYFVAWYNK